MADHSIAVLNVGSQSITLAVFESTQKGLALHKYATSNILADPVNEAVRNAQVKVAIDNLVEQLGVSKAKVMYAVSGQSVFTRFVKLPALGDQNIEQLVTFEAQQHIPFPIEEVAWDWELMDAAGAEKEVAIVAIKRDLLNDIDGVITETGLKTSSAGSALMALTNAFYYSYPEVTEPTLLIDFGAKATNLIYIGGKRIFIRSINISGVSLTSAISNEYTVDFAEAERYKTESGRVAINGAYLQEWDEATGALATIISNVLSRLPSEISRTTNFYRSQHSGTAPTRVLLAGAGANLSYLKEFIEDRLKLPTEYFNPLRRVTLGGGVSAEQISPLAHTMGEIVGLAARGADKNVLSIDLVPDSIKESRAEAKKRPYFLGAAVMFMLGTLIWAGAQFSFAKVADEKLNEVKTSFNKLKPFGRQLKALQIKRGQLDVIGNEYTEVIKNRYRAVERLEELRGYFASEIVWLDSVEDLIDYVPGEDAGEKKGDDFVYVSKGFKDISYGSPATKPIAEPSNKKPQAQASLINAVRIKGYWRNNPKGQQVVFEILERIKESTGSSFTLLFNGKELDDGEILSIQSVINEDEISAPFIMTLPLANPVSVTN